MAELDTPMEAVITFADGEGKHHCSIKFGEFEARAEALSRLTFLNGATEHKWTFFRNGQPIGHPRGRNNAFHVIAEMVLLDNKHRRGM